jgi:hypothetical protein
MTLFNQIPRPFHMHFGKKSVQLMSFLEWHYVIYHKEVIECSVSADTVTSAFTVCVKWPFSVPFTLNLVWGSEKILSFLNGSRAK